MTPTNNKTAQIRENMYRSDAGLISLCHPATGDGRDEGSRGGDGDGGEHREERKTMADRPDWRKDIY